MFFSLDMKLGVLFSFVNSFVANDFCSAWVLCRWPSIAVAVVLVVMRLVEALQLDSIGSFNILILDPKQRKLTPIWSGHAHA